MGFQDIYGSRPLPYIFGTDSYIESRDAGLGADDLLTPEEAAALAANNVSTCTSSFCESRCYEKKRKEKKNGNVIFFLLTVTVLRFLTVLHRATTTATRSWQEDALVVAVWVRYLKKISKTFAMMTIATHPL
jgi:hypothetical protein